jgi:hypothetical protein
LFCLVAFFEKFNKIMLKNEKTPLVAGLFGQKQFMGTYLQSLI